MDSRFAYANIVAAEKDAYYGYFSDFSHKKLFIWWFSVEKQIYFSSILPILKVTRKRPLN